MAAQTTQEKILRKKAESNEYLEVKEMVEISSLPSLPHDSISYWLSKD